ncbi:MAG TPA: SUMF1/EgtB/PvdO family nonheme iron enzyme, partial [Pirellulaceae bacterium]
ALVNEMIFQGRYAVLIRPEVAANLTPPQRQEVARVLKEEMSEVRPGRVLLSDASRSGTESMPPAEVEHLFTDRYAVSNAEYQEFVNAGCYEEPELWAEEIRDSLSTFQDLSHKPGPRYWRNSRYPVGTADMPVVGVCWYEADAYARWVGKRLPADAEWVKTAVSPRASIVATEQLTRYPWGNAFRDDRANLWSSGKNQPVPVAEYPGGQTSEGVCQMIGNVWEWLRDDLRQTFRGGELEGKAADFKAIRGGAFDTYIESQAAATCTSGDSPLARRDNIGFRCVLPAKDVAREVFQPELPQNSGSKSLT